VADLVAFCRRRQVRGNATLTGGNPFLFPGFMDLYRAISETDLDVSILGNPVSSQRLRELVAIRKPSHFQVSLEGLEETNDAIRGQRHFRRVMDFLPMLREAGVRSGVMLTLGRENLDQVLPLAEYLRDRVDRFNFNRLCQTGEASCLDLPSREQYSEFLQQYVAAARSNPIMRFKDNLFNILRHESGQPLHRGCTGHGCGAAFDFVALLPDGEAHACRKFPSPIGNVLESGFEKVYASEAAERYRQGCRSCDSCPIRAACGGCLAVTAGQGRNPFEDRDPHCSFSEARRNPE
jgi:selenobiotic family peptide radical SAM maturase